MGKFKTFLNERFFKADNIKNSYYSGYVEIFTDPTPKELNSLYKDSYDNGVRIGINKNKIYVWIEDVLHNLIQKRFGLKFDVRMEYTKNGDTLFLSSEETGKNFKKLDKKIFNKLKTMFPNITKIDYSTSPFTTVYKYDK